MEHDLYQVFFHILPSSNMAKFNAFKEICTIYTLEVSEKIKTI